LVTLSLMTQLSRLTAAVFFFGVCLLIGSCGSSHASVQPSIEFTKLPPAGEGSPQKLDAIEGRVTGARRGQKIVLFARSGVWWVQPLADQPFTPIQSDSTWKSATHPGSAYAALLVDSSYHPPSTMDALPNKGGPVWAVATVESQLVRPEPKTLQFSGYEWRLRQAVGNAGGSTNYYDPANAWTDKNGFLHLRISRVPDRPDQPKHPGEPERWTSAEVSLTRSLGYGSYRFVVRDVSHLEPAVALSMSTWDDSGPPREMNIEVSRWGEPTSKNAQYVIQPYYVPANTVRFEAPSGTLTYRLRWEPGRALFKTLRGSSSGESGAVSEHLFTSGIPSPGNETIQINLYVFGNKRNPLQHPAEVIIEKFEYLP
jgi:hypothetical protein